MAKKSSIEKNKRRMRMVASKGARRDILRAIIKDKTVPLEERFAASIKLSEEPVSYTHLTLPTICSV